MIYSKKRNSLQQTLPSDNRKMSFKDVRDLADQLKLLGFPNVFPMQALATNFGTLASFHIVCDILQWLAGLLEPGAVLPGGIHNEDERILLIRSATEFFVTKSAIKLNPRKLYASSSVTATELQKITRLLITPTQSEQERDDDENYRSLNQVDIGDKMDDLRRARELSSDLTQRGAALHDLLSKEMANKEERLAQTNRPMELSSVERTLKNAINATQLKLQSSRAQLENARIEMNALSSKVQRKRAELERTKQRLEALQKIRPAHMQEFEECEKELQIQFQQYFLHIHVRDALRAQLEARTKHVSPIASPILQKPAESSMPFIPEGLIEDGDDDIDDEETQLNGIGGDNADGGTNGDGGRGLRRLDKFGLDAEIPDIRDEDLMLREAKRSALINSSKRPGRPIKSRIRPTTGRSRRPTAETQLITENENVGQSEARTKTSGHQLIDDDSSFGSSGSDLDIEGILGTEIGANVDDDFDLNSMDDISISKITGELPIRPKTASKPEHHSDEDF